VIQSLFFLARYEKVSKGSRYISAVVMYNLNRIHLSFSGWHAFEVHRKKIAETNHKTAD